MILKRSLNEHSQFGDRLRHYRRKAGLSQTGLGKAIGRDRHYVRRIERGLQALPATHLCDICSAIKVDVRSFLEAKSVRLTDLG